MKKSTDDLMKILRSKHSVEEYFDENDSEMFFGTLTEMLDFYRLRGGLSKGDVVRGSTIKREYCYELLRGDVSKKPSRDKVIMLCFGLRLGVDECQQVLKKSGYAPLYARDARDSLIIFSVNNGISVVKTNIKLAEYGLEPLE